MLKEEMKLWETNYKQKTWTDLEDKCLGTTHRIKPVACTVLPWIHTHFKYIKIVCIFAIKSL